MKRIHRLLFALLSGVLLSLPWLGFPGWLLFVAFVPLLLLDNWFVKFKAAFPGVSFFGHVFLAALIWNILSAWWMTKISFFGVAIAMVFNAFLMSLVFWAAHSIRRKFSSSLGYIALLAFWMAYEYLQFNWDMEWPCLQLGSALASGVQLIQWYEYTGTFGGTFWILILNVLLFRFALRLHEKAPVQQTILTLITYLILLITPLSLSYRMYSKYVEVENPRNIVIIQPNVDPYAESFDVEAEKLKLRNFLRLACEVSTDETNFILGPETVFENPEYWNEDDIRPNEFLEQLEDFMLKYKNAELVFGVSSFKTYSNNEDFPITARNRNGTVYDLFNTALFLNRVGETQVYHKSKLVAGVEKTPFFKYFPFVKNKFIDLGGASGNLGIQREVSNFKSKDGLQVAPVICFESVFGEYVTTYVKKGAQLLFIITNDGWWKNSRGYKQHLLFSQLRAIETRRSIARAANTGTSCFINQRGNVIQPSNWWQEAAIAGSVNANSTITFYVKHGDYIARGAVFVSVFLGLLVFVKRFK